MAQSSGSGSSGGGQYSQKDRLLTISTKLGADKLLLERFSGTEELSTPYEFRLAMLAENPAIDLKSLLRTPVTVALTLADSSPRYFHGIFSSLRQGGFASERLACYEATIVPAVWFLSLYEDCRIFQNLSVPEIVEKVLKEKGVSNFDMPSDWDSRRTYKPREYCVQYRET